MQTRCARCGADAVVNRKLLIDSSTSSSSGTSMMRGSATTPGGQLAFNFSAYGTSSSQSRTDLARDLAAQRLEEVASAVRDVMLDAVERYILALGAHGISAFNPVIPYDAPGARFPDGWPVFKGVYVLAVNVEGTWARAGIFRIPGGRAQPWMVSMIGLGTTKPRPVSHAVHQLLETNHQIARLSFRSFPGKMLQFSQGVLSGRVRPLPAIQSVTQWIVSSPKRLSGAAVRAKQVRPAFERDVRSRIAAIDSARSICTRCGSQY